MSKPSCISFQIEDPSFKMKMTGLIKVYKSSSFLLKATDVYSETIIKLKGDGLLVYTKDIVLSQTLCDSYSFSYIFPYSKVYTIDSLMNSPVAFLQFVKTNSSHIRCIAQ